jgi:hypothetical protein
LLLFLVESFENENVLGGSAVLGFDIPVQGVKTVQLGFKLETELYLLFMALGQGCHLLFQFFIKSLGLLQIFMDLVLGLLQ